MNVTEFKQKYTQYRGFSDDTIARAVHAKYYYNKDYDDFAIRFGVTPTPAQQIRPIAEELVSTRGFIAAGEPITEGKPALISPIGIRFKEEMFGEHRLLPTEKYIKDIKCLFHSF